MDLDTTHYWTMSERDRRELGIHLGPELEMLEQSGMVRIDAQRIERWWVCVTDGDDFTPEGSVNAYGVIGCHKHRPFLYDPDEYDHEHDECGWVTIIRGEK